MSDKNYELAEIQANLRYYRNNLQVWDEVGYDWFKGVKFFTLNKEVV